MQRRNSGLRGGGGGEQEIQTEFNISYKDTVYAQGIEPVFANN